MQHEAIYALYNNVERIIGNGASAVAKDKNGDVVSWDASAVATKEAELLAESKLGQLRYERNLLIGETDWWAMSDTATMTDAQKTYRQSLRDITKTYKSLDSKDITFEELKVFELLCNDLIENNEKLKTCLCPEAYSVVLPKDETENIYPTPEEKEKQLESQLESQVEILFVILESIEKNLNCCYELELKVEKNIGSGVEETKSDDTEKIGVSILFEPIEHLIEMIKSVC